MFFVVMYILMLPPINHTVNSKVLAHTEFISKGNSTSNTSNLLQRGSRSTITNKQKFLVPPTAANVILFIFVLSSLALFYLTKKSNIYLTVYHIPQFNNYLSLRTLRI
ncbi:MAG: hypothetical protein JWP71_2759 [Mucilaginibacter sp.]|nr:hypothetical protein [Mucilaginibacter sp.]